MIFPALQRLRQKSKPVQLADVTALRNSFALELLPLILIFAYLLATIWLFFEGPIPWPITNGKEVFVYLLLVLVVIFISFTFGVQAKVRKAELKPWKLVFLVGALGNVLLLFPSAYIYTGRMPWQLLEAFQNQNAAYLGMLGRVAEGSILRSGLSVLRALAYPFVFAVIPLGLLNWRKLSTPLRLLLVLSMFTNVVFSVLRGTDREIVDLGVMIGASGLLIMGRYCWANGISLTNFLTRRSVLAAIAIFLILALVAFNVFVDRRLQRYSGNADTVCVGVQRICADEQHPTMKALGQTQRFGLAMATAYAAQGYYGVALAMGLDYQSTFGIGHSSLVARIYAAVTGDEELYHRSYTARLGSFGWSDQYQWPSLLTWLANDVGFPGAVVVIGIFAWVWGRSWKDAAFSNDDSAAIVFCFMMQMFFYLPANNQIMQTLDAYFALTVWMGIWLWLRRNKAISSVGIGA